MCICVQRVLLYGNFENQPQRTFKEVVGRVAAMAFCQVTTSNHFGIMKIRRMLIYIYLYSYNLANKFSLYSYEAEIFVEILLEYKPTKISL